MKQLPLRIGVYYSSELMSYDQTESLFGGTRAQFPIGEASARFFDEFFPRFFQETERVNHRPPLPQTGEPVDAVIEPRIESFTVDDPIYPGLERWRVSISYLFTLYSAEGEPIATWTAAGRGGNKTTFSWSGHISLAAEATNRAIEAAGQNFIHEFDKIPELRRWLKIKGVSP